MKIFNKNKADKDLENKLKANYILLKFLTEFQKMDLNGQNKVILELKDTIKKQEKLLGDDDND